MDKAILRAIKNYEAENRSNKIGRCSGRKKGCVAWNKGLKKGENGYKKPW